jgi:hypothetical protein
MTKLAPESQGKPLIIFRNMNIKHKTGKNQRLLHGT